MPPFEKPTSATRSLSMDRSAARSSIAFTRNPTSSQPSCLAFPQQNPTFQCRKKPSSPMPFG